MELEANELIEPSPPSVPSREISNSTMTCSSPRPFDIQALTAEEVDSIWEKLRESSFGDYNLTHDDSYEILCLISSLVKVDVTKTIGEITERILNGISQKHVHDIDEEYMKHLVTSYSKLINADDEASLHSDDSNETSNRIEFGKDTKEVIHSDDAALIERLRLPADAIMLLGHIREWNFDVFQLQEVTAYPLVAVAETTLNELNLTFSMDVHIMKLRRFLVDIADGYLTTNTYHNQLHAADVTQTMYHFLSSCRLSQVLGLNNLAILSLVIGAAIHDVAHPGVTGKYLIAVGDMLAVQYNDNSPLENMHLSTAFQLLSKPQNNFMEKFPKSTFREFRRMIIEMVLSTDNDRHFALMEKVEGLISSGEATMSLPSPMVRRDSVHKLSRTQSAYSTKSQSPAFFFKPDQSSIAPTSVSSSSAQLFATKRRSLDGSNGLTSAASSIALLPSPPPSSISPRGIRNHPNSTSYVGLPSSQLGSHAGAGATAGVVNPQNHVTEARQLLLMQLALHAADVSNPVKPWELHIKWYPRLMNEFYHQGDLERDLGYPISYAFDRHNPVPQPKFQLGFLKAIVFPMYKTFSRIPSFNISHCLSSLENNIANWEALNATELESEPLMEPSKVVEKSTALGLSGKEWAPKKK